MDFISDKTYHRQGSYKQRKELHLIFVTIFIYLYIFLVASN